MNLQKLQKCFNKTYPILLILASIMLLIIFKDYLNPILKEYQLVFELVLLSATLVTLFYLVISISIARETLNSNKESLKLMREEFWYSYSALDVSAISYDLKPENGKDPEITVFFNNPATNGNRVTSITIVHGSFFPYMTAFNTRVRTEDVTIPPMKQYYPVTYYANQNCDQILEQKDVLISFLDSRITSYWAKIRIKKPKGAISNIKFQKHYLHNT